MWNCINYNFTQCLSQAWALRDELLFASGLTPCCCCSWVPSSEGQEKCRLQAVQLTAAVKQGQHWAFPRVTFPGAKHEQAIQILVNLPLQTARNRNPRLCPSALVQYFQKPQAQILDSSFKKIKDALCVRTLKFSPEDSSVQRLSLADGLDGATFSILGVHRRYHKFKEKNSKRYRLKFRCNNIFSLHCRITSLERGNHEWGGMEVWSHLGRSDKQGMERLWCSKPRNCRGPATCYLGRSGHNPLPVETVQLQVQEKRWWTCQNIIKLPIVVSVFNLGLYHGVLVQEGSDSGFPLSKAVRISFPAVNTESRLLEHPPYCTYTGHKACVSPLTMGNQDAVTLHNMIWAAQLYKETCCIPQLVPKSFLRISV